MIITRTPFRITFGGGGTDLRSYYEQNGGFIFSAAIDKYMYIGLNEPFDGLIRVKYSKSETVKHRDEIQHEIVREALRMMDIEKGIEVVSIADIPAGTGLGSSSCFLVGLLNALHAYKKNYVSLQDIAEEACRLEIDVLKSPIGKQDQYMATFGGLTVLEIAKDGKTAVRSARISDTVLHDLNRNMMIFFTDTSRQANTILSEQKLGLQQAKDDVIKTMHFIKETGYKILEAAESGNITKIGLLFDEHWQHKKKLSGKITNPHFDQIYDTAKANGALGGKIIGAGGGGFFLFYVEENHGRFLEQMVKMGLRPMRYGFAHEGTKVLANV